MGKKILISFTLLLAFLSIILGIRKNKEIAIALSFIKDLEANQKVIEEKALAFKELYLQHIYLGELSINGTFLGLNNKEVPFCDVIRPDHTIAYFISDSACLECHRNYLALLFKYFYKDAVILRLGPLLNDQEFLGYRIFGLVGCSELEKIVDSKKSLISFINSKNTLQYIYLTSNNDLDLFEEYLIALTEEVAR